MIHHSSLIGDVSGQWCGDCVEVSVKAAFAQKIRKT